MKKLVLAQLLGVVIGVHSTGFMAAESVESTDKVKPNEYQVTVEGWDPLSVVDYTNGALKVFPALEQPKKHPRVKTSYFFKLNDTLCQRTFDSPLFLANSDKLVFRYKDPETVEILDIWEEGKVGAVYHVERSLTGSEEEKYHSISTQTGKFVEYFPSYDRGHMPLDAQEERGTGWHQRSTLVR